MKTLYTVALVMGASLVIGAPNTHAAASKTMSGAACTPENLVIGVGNGYYREITADGFYNDRLTPINATCDLVRDNSTNTTNEVDVFVRVTDNSSTYGFECAVQSCSHTGTSCSSTAFSTGESFTGTESINAPISTSFFNGYYVVTCSVPPDSTIHSLYVFEPE